MRPGTLLRIVLIERFGSPALARISILPGILIGTVIAIPMGMVHWGKVPNANWVGVTTPFYFGFPIFEISAIVSMCIVGLVIMTETTGHILAIGQIVDVKIDQRRLADGLRADGLSTVLGGVFNTFPYTAFAQNVGLVSITGVRSRYVATFAGGVLILLGLTPKMSAIVEGIPAAGPASTSVEYAMMRGAGGQWSARATHRSRAGREECREQSDRRVRANGRRVGGDPDPGRTGVPRRAARQVRGPP